MRRPHIAGTHIAGTFAAAVIVALLGPAVTARSFVSLRTASSNPHFSASQTSPVAYSCGGRREFIIDTDSMSITGKLPQFRTTGCARERPPPYVCDIGFEGRLVYKSTCHDGLVAMDTNGTVVFKSAPVKDMSGAFGPAAKDGKVYVALQSGAIVVVDGATGVLLQFHQAAIAKAASRPIVLSRHLAYVGEDGELYVMALMTRQVTKVTPSIRAVMVSSDFDAAVVSSAALDVDFTSGEVKSDEAVIVNCGSALVRVNVHKTTVEWSVPLVPVSYSKHRNALSFVVTETSVFVMSGPALLNVDRTTGSVSSRTPADNVRSPVGVVRLERDRIVVAGRHSMDTFDERTGAFTLAFSPPSAMHSAVQGIFTSADKTALLLHGGGRLVKTDA